MNDIKNHNRIIEGLEQKIEDSLSGFGIGAKIKTAVRLAAESVFLTVLEEPGAEILRCDIIRSTKELALEIVFSTSDSIVRSLNDPEEALILHNICKKMGFRFTIQAQSDGTKLHFQIEKYHPFADNLRFLFQYLGKDKKQLVVGFAFNLLAITTSLMIPFFTGRMIVAYTDNDLYRVFAVAAAILIAQILHAVVFHSASSFYTNATFRLEKNIYVRVLEEYFKIKPEALEKAGSGLLIKRITEDPNIISQALTAIFSKISDAVYYNGVMLASFVISPSVCAAELVLIVGLMFLEYRRGVCLDIDTRKATAVNDSRSEITVDLMSGANEVKLLNGKKRFAEKISEYAVKYDELIEQATVRSERKMVFNDIFISTGYALVVVFLGYAIWSGRMVPSDALILFNYYSIVGMPVVALIQEFVDLKKQLNISCERVRNVIEGYEFPKESNGTAVLSDAKGDIRLNNVSFAYFYDDPLERNIEIFKNLSLEIPAGSTVAFVGRSGCGKSTLLKMISGQRRCNGGNITFDGIDYRDLDKASLYENISVINQSPYIFNMTVRENLLCAKPDATEEELKAACEKAMILDDVLHMDNGFDSVLGERGAKLSGGQRQRIAIARAFLRNSAVIILDEATSALDNVTQNAVMNAISEMYGKQTVIIVAHRLSTIQNADKIFVIADKKIKDCGTHTELMSRCEEYRALYTFEDVGKI